jgi:hypothetical protein
MLRTALLSLAGLVVGVGVTAGLLRLTWVVVGWITDPQVFRVAGDPILYPTVVLGAGFGALCGAVVGLAGVLARAIDRPQTRGDGGAGGSPAGPPAGNNPSSSPSASPG